MVERERKLCFKYFYDNFTREEKVYGLTPDSVHGKHYECSVAADGFMLAGMAIGADFGYISREEAESICIKSLKTHKSLARENGFFYHFYTMDTGERSRRCELSLIDTALFIAGALTAGAYFGGETLALARELYSGCEWEKFYSHKRKMFYMAKFDNIGFSGYWDCYAEQLIVYFLAAGSENGQKVGKEGYDSFIRLKGEYGGYEYIYSWFGSLFTHQFSHAFIDFKGYKDADGTDWYENTVKATLANRQFCIDRADEFKGFGENGWGLTSCLTRGGYTGHLGVKPSGNGGRENYVDGTIPPAGALGSAAFTPEESLAALEHFYSMDALVGEFGLKDAYNEGLGWFSEGYISIDKGITLLSLANLDDRRTVWKYFSTLPEIKTAYQVLGFKKEN